MKENIYGNRVITDLKTPEIKLYIEENVRETLEKENFKFNKSNFKFKKRDNIGLQEISFNILNYAPLNYNLSFTLRIVNYDIEKIKEDFSKLNKSDLFGFATIQIFLGDFLNTEDILAIVNKWNGLFYDKDKNEFIKDKSVAKIETLTLGQISGFRYELYDSKDLIECMKEINLIISEKVIPLCQQLSSLDGIDSFFLKRELFSANSLRQNNFEAELIASKLNGKRELSTVFNSVVQLINKGISSGVFDERVKTYIDRLYNYLK
jgi:hypothetical protein